LISTAVKRIYDALHEGEGDALKLDGVTRLLEYPEYSNAEQLRNMLWTFEDKDSVFDVILNAKNEGVNVYIGSENPLDASHNSSLVFKTISQGERVLGAIGVIGPRRMDYSKVIKTVEYLTQSITEMLLDADTALPPPKED
jgi:heat-inducible transcriptional repressor